MAGQRRGEFVALWNVADWLQFGQWMRREGKADRPLQCDFFAIEAAADLICTLWRHLCRRTIAFRPKIDYIPPSVASGAPNALCGRAER